MSKFKAMVNWIFKAWPALVIVAIVLIHCVFYTIIKYDTNIVDKYISAILQIVGGLFIILSVNENIEDFRHSNLLSMFCQYFKSCPCKRRQPITANVNVTLGTATLSAHAESISIRRRNTIDERFSDLEKQIEEARQLIVKQEKMINTKIDSVQNRLESLITTNNLEIREVSDKLDKSVIGNIKYEILGVLLLLYGVLLNLF